MPANTVSVTRPGKWGNPHRVGDDLSYYLGPASKRATAAQCVELYRRLWEAAIKVAPDVAASALSQLRNKNLACFCRLCPAHQDGKPFDIACSECEPCHADVLGMIAND